MRHYKTSILGILLMISLVFNYFGWTKYYNIRNEMWRITTVTLDHRLLLSEQYLKVLNTKIQTNQPFNQEAAMAASWLSQLQSLSTIYFPLLHMVKPNTSYERTRIVFENGTNIKMVSDLVSVKKLNPKQKAAINDLTQIYSQLRNSISSKDIIDGNFARSEELLQP